MPIEPPKDLNEQLLAVAIVNAGAAETSKSLDTFSSWLTAGTAAAIGLLLGNVSGIAEHLAIGDLRHALVILPWAFVFAVLERLCASSIAASLKAQEAGARLGAEAATRGEDVDFTIVFEKAASVFPYPFHRLARKSFLRAEQGDLLGPARASTRIVLLQRLFLLVQVAMVVWALVSIASRLVA